LNDKRDSDGNPSGYSAASVGLLGFSADRFAGTNAFLCWSNLGATRSKAISCWTGSATTRSSECH